MRRSPAEYFQDALDEGVWRKRWLDRTEKQEYVRSYNSSSALGCRSRFCGIS
jgi:hypothetical protein